MAEEGVLILSQKELNRLHIVHKALAREITQREAAEILSLSYRQMKRIVKRVKLKGDAGIAHKSRGRPSNRRLHGEMRERVIGLYGERYNDFGPTLASEKLAQLHGIRVSVETLRSWLIRSGDWKGKRKSRKHRQWRERKHYFGELVQMDGSHHDWFEGRGEDAVFMGYIDDATGKAFGRFYGHEGTMPAMDSFKRYIRKYGIPASVYVDKHSTYKSTAKPSIEENLSNREPLSEFERALEELGVRVIHANSPQAKGRVERLFGTLQDRLVKEMRLRNISSAEEANEFLEEYLPEHNKRFAVAPKEREDLHRRAPAGMNLDRVLCIKSERTLRNDFTISYENKIYQIEESIRGKKVVVEERINGAIRIGYKGRTLRFKDIAARPAAAKKAKEFSVRKKWRPPQDHPWRRWRARRRTALAARRSPLGSQQERAVEMSQSMKVGV